MASLDDITPMIITLNEEVNIERCLSGLEWAKKILVIDSFSTDRTLEILKKDSRIQILQRKFDDFASQCNFGLKHIETKWVLSLDADYVITPDLIEEITTAFNKNDVSGYKIPLKACVYGKPLRSSIFPPRICLYQKKLSHYTMGGHGHVLKISGKTETISTPILVDDYKNLSVWFQNQAAYSRIEAEKVLKTNFRNLKLKDKIRKLQFISPFLVIPYCLFYKLGFLDGIHGIYYAFTRSMFELLVSINILDIKLFPAKSKNQ
jgi:glycosyltransferase involved in cell wall biosynthesis